MSDDNTKDNVMRQSVSIETLSLQSIRIELSRRPTAPIISCSGCIVFQTVGERCFIFPNAIV